MSEGEKQIPVPRPRQLKASDEADATGKVYENYKIPASKTDSVYDSLHEQLSELRADAVHRPVPVPRVRTAVAPKRDYENAPDLLKVLNNRQHETEVSPSRTGAIRKVPNIPSVKNNLDEPDHVQEPKDFDVLSQTSSTSNKSGGDSKFTTPSPG